MYNIFFKHISFPMRLVNVTPNVFVYRELYGSFLTVSFAKTRGLSRRSSRNNSYRDSLRCYSCNRVGHFSRSCKEVNYGYRR